MSLELKNELIRVINEISIEQTKTETKQKYTPKYDQKHYESLIWNSKEYCDVEKIEVELIQVQNEDHRDLFDYIRHYVSCMPQFQTPGRVLSVLVHDKTSKRYLGILQFTTDLLNSEHKDAYIGLDTAKKGRFKKHIRDHSVNLSICVPVQPFGFQFCGGKLLAMLSFSNEIHQMYENKYSYPLALIVTTSIHGKSIQYDRLKQMKFIGYTKGFGTSHISTSLFDRVKNYIISNHPEFNVSKKSKWQCLKFIAQKLNIDTNRLFFHGQQRGIYAGLTGTNSKEFLVKKSLNLEQNKIEPVEAITYFWKERWAKQRSTHLSKVNYENAET